jgi:hypothetical protein
MSNLLLLFLLLSVVSSVAQLGWLLGWDEECSDVKFDAYGLPAASRGKTLVGAGMRRKNLFITEVDVYAVGLYASSSVDKAASSSWSSKTLSNKDTHLVLQFAREVGTDKIVNAIVDSLASFKRGDKYKKQLTAFKTTLLGGMGGGGVAKGDLIEFLFSSSSIEITVRGNSAGKVKSSELKEALMDVYVNKKKSVAPELVKAVTERWSD